MVNNALIAKLIKLMDLAWKYQKKLILFAPLREF